MLGVLVLVLVVLASSCARACPSDDVGVSKALLVLDWCTSGTLKSFLGQPNPSDQAMLQAFLQLMVALQGPRCRPETLKSFRGVQPNPVLAALELQGGLQ